MGISSIAQELSLTVQKWGYPGVTLKREFLLSPKKGDIRYCILCRNKAEVFEILSSLPEEVFASITAAAGQNSEVTVKANSAAASHGGSIALLLVTVIHSWRL